MYKSIIIILSVMFLLLGYKYGLRDKLNKDKSDSVSTPKTIEYLHLFDASTH